MLLGAVAFCSAVNVGASVTVVNTGVVVASLASDVIGPEAEDAYAYIYVIVLSVLLTVSSELILAHPLPILLSVNNGVSAVVPVEA